MHQISWVRARSFLRARFPHCDREATTELARLFEETLKEGFLAGMVAEHRDDARDIPAVSFQGLAGGDVECFCWHGVPDADAQRLNPCGDNCVYPDYVIHALGCVPGRPYRFTVIAEKLDGVDYSTDGDHAHEDEGQADGTQS